MLTPPAIAFGKSQKGQRHQKNDDRFLVEVLDQGHILVAVTDGMGGHPAGDVAAEDVIDALSMTDIDVIDKLAALTVALNRADFVIRDRVKRVPVVVGMGATATAAIINDGFVWWVHIGDSRMYLMRNGILQQITKDHTFLQDLIDNGDISEEEAISHPMAHVLDQCVGCMDAGVDRGSFAVFPGDIILLCTDGLYRTVPESKITHILSSEKCLSKSVERLIKISVQAGSLDDTTIVVACITGS